MSKQYVDQIAPEHDRTNCTDNNRINAAIDDSDCMGMGRCFRCTLLNAAEPAAPEPTGRTGVLKLCVGCGKYLEMANFDKAAADFPTRDGHNFKCQPCVGPYRLERDPVTKKVQVATPKT